MYKLNFKKRVWIVKQYLKGIPTSKISLAQRVSRMTVSNLIRTYKQDGWDGLKDYIIHYNEERPHMSLNYKTPKEVWDELT